MPILREICLRREAHVNRILVRKDRAARKSSASVGGSPSEVIGALAMIGNIEPFEFRLLRYPEPDGKVDDFIEDRRAATRPEEREQHVLRLDDPIP